MRRAVAQARRSFGLAGPGPLVGASVISADGAVVGDGHQRGSEGTHAVALALDQAGRNARGGTLYCTLEPCVACANQIVEAGIASVVGAAEDPQPSLCGRAFVLLRERGVVVRVAVGAPEANELNRPYLTSIRMKRPMVTLKAATSLDGRLAATRGASTRITSAPAQRHAHSQRATIDAIAVGSGTLLADDPLLTARLVHRVRPLTRVILDRRLRTPPTARLFSTLSAGPVIIVTSEAAVRQQHERAVQLEAAGASLVVPEHSDIKSAVRAVGALGIQSLILEGGSMVHQAAWDAGVVDYVQLYVAPVTLGGDGPVLLGGRPLATTLVDQCVRSLGPDVLIEGYVHGTR